MNRNQSLGRDHGNTLESERIPYVKYSVAALIVVVTGLLLICGLGVSLQDFLNFLDAILNFCPNCIVSTILVFLSLVAEVLESFDNEYSMPDVRTTAIKEFLWMWFLFHCIDAFTFACKQETLEVFASMAIKLTLTIIAEFCFDTKIFERCKILQPGEVSEPVVSEPEIPSAKYFKRAFSAFVTVYLAIGFFSGSQDFWDIQEAIVKFCPNCVVSAMMMIVITYNEIWNSNDNYSMRRALVAAFRHFCLMWHCFHCVDILAFLWYQEPTKFIVRSMTFKLQGAFLVTYCFERYFSYKVYDWCKISEPEVSEPELSEPEVSEPEVSEPELSEPEVSEPEVSEPEVPEPEVPETKVSELEVELFVRPSARKIRNLILRRQRTRKDRSCSLI